MRKRKGQNMDKLIDWGNIKSEVYPVIVSQDDSTLDKLVWLPWMDLAVCFAVRFSLDVSLRCQIRVTKSMMSAWKISKKTLFQQAIDNQKVHGYQAKNVRQLLEELIPDVLAECQRPAVCPARDTMIVLTNEENYYGAALLLDKELLRKVAGQKNMYILPSSVHELILLPEQAYMEKERVDAMVKEVNSTAVPKSDWLSDHAYYYDWQTEEIVA